MDELVAIAKIVRSRGLKGELAAELLTDFPERFENLETVTALSPDGDRLQLKIEKFWFQKDRIILKFAGYDTIERAEELRDHEICIPESEAVELESDEFFDWQLEGCMVETVDGQRIGEVLELMRPGGTELLVVKGDTKEYLIPFAESICVEVDIENKRIKIDPPEGLLEF
jgi:16S rRNA processing protein RimM